MSRKRTKQQMNGGGVFLINGFNAACNNITSSSLKVGDKSMSEICFHMTKGNLPQLSHIFRKPEPLGTELKTDTCSVTGALIFV